MRWDLVLSGSALAVSVIGGVFSGVAFARSPKSETKLAKAEAKAEAKAKAKAEKAEK